MKHLNITLFAAIIITTSTACKKDFLELTDTNFLNRQTYVNNLKTMEQFVNGIHVTVSRDLLRDLSASYPEVIADNLKPNPLLSPARLLPHYSWSQLAEEKMEPTPDRDSKAMNGDWKSLYLNIRSCSFVIEDVDKYKSENEQKANKLKGQAYAIRALLHFKLANTFAQTYTFTADASHIGIPYINTSDITVPFIRQSVKENYVNIITDLTEAIKLLPVENINTRYMNYLAAKSILARVYLYMGNYEQALQTAMEVTSKVSLMTIDAGYPDALFKNIPSAQTEILYQLSPIATTGTTYVNTYFASPALRNREFLPTQDIINILTGNPSDVRSGWVTRSDNDWTGTKFPTGVAGVDPYPLNDYYPSVIRSSEMFLTISECAAKTNKEDIAREYLNAIRKRAAPAIDPVTATGPALIDSIYKERRKELAFEGLRMHDIQRWHQDIQRSDPSDPNLNHLPYPSSRAIAPIPIQDVNIAGIQQNKDY